MRTTYPEEVLLSTTEVPVQVLDAAFDRLGQWGFDDLDGYPNHAPMTCEALAALGRPVEVDAWSRLDGGTPPVVPRITAGFAWESALGDLTRTDEWLGHVERAVADNGPLPTLADWLPRLVPSLAAGLFHGAIRCAHAARAISAADTPARRAELGRALAFWAALCTPSYPPDLDAARGVDDVEQAVARAAADGARRYLARPNIINLHGVTGAMAVQLLLPHTDDATGRTALAHLVAEHRALYDGVEPVDEVPTPSLDDETLVDAAVASGEAHAVKLVEACRRGFTLTGDPVFRAAAERVVRRGLRALRDAEPS